MTDGRGDRLSERGEERKRGMLTTLQDEMRRVHARRARRGRVVAGTLVVAIVVGATAWLAPRPTSVSPTPSLSESTTPTPPVAEPASSTLLRTDASTVDRYMVATSADNVPSVSDEELLSALHAAGHDCGIVRVHGNARLSCDVVLDDGRTRPGSSG